MKIRLPHLLMAALLGAVTVPHAALAAVSITDVKVRSAQDISDHSDVNAHYELLNDVDAKDKGVRTTGNYQLWEGNGWVLTLGGNKVQDAGGSVFFKAFWDGDRLLASGFRDFRQLGINGNSVSGANGGAISGERGAALEIKDNMQVDMCGNSALSGGAVYVRSEGDAGGGWFGSLTISGNGDMLFDGNTATGGYGGALYCTAITISDNNGTLRFIDNTSQEGGGAIAVETKGFGSLDFLRITDNETLVFSGNSAKHGGGAICADGTAKLEIRGNELVSFTGNKVTQSGGAAILANKAIISNNTTLLVQGNENSSGSPGGAVYAYDLEMDRNGSLSFSGNEGACEGMAVYVKNTLSMCYNDYVEFSRNVGSGTFANGALYTDSAALIMGNGDMEFSGNSATIGAAGYVSYCSLSLTANDRISFTGNTVTGSSAYPLAGGMFIHVNGNTQIADNNRIEFRDNLVNDTKTGNTFLRGLYVSGNSSYNLSISASVGQEILIYDTAMFDYCPGMRLNSVKVGPDWQATGGWIVFSGKYAEEDLKKHKKDYSAEELLLSRTSTITATTTLYGGGLSVEDGAVLALNGLDVESGAKLNLSGGSIAKSPGSGPSYNPQLTIKNGAALSLEGANSVSASSLTLADGSRVNLTLTGSDPALTLDGSLQLGKYVAFNVTTAPGRGLAEDAALIAMADGTTPGSWDFSKVTMTVDGETIDDPGRVYWRKGTLYCSRDYILGWIGGDSNVWAENDDKNWSYSSSTDTPRAYRNNAALFIRDVQGGSLVLQGELTPLSVAVDSDSDVAFTGDGYIAGAGTLIKGGTGTLLVETANTYTGGTSIEKGTVVMGSASALGSGDITMTVGTLDLGGHSLSNSVTVEGPSSIGNGTINGSVTVKKDASAHFIGETYIKDGTVTAGDTSIKALADDAPGLLQELTVKDGLIAGTEGRPSLADGLYIESAADLMIQGMTITANNEIHVGDNTITLREVTIKLSEDSYELVDDVYYFKLSNLFHCSVDMADVVFDASDLTLPEGFNPATDSIAFKLGDAKLTPESAGRDIYLLMDGQGSRTMSIDPQGNPVFTKLVPIPEPTTGTLSLLALAALAARRRKYN
ncbi:MAG: hypothetical protein MJ058_05790 [Akkermansia sp.]|nr:hypothetical protein [Akkermansia sp.]